MNTSDIIKGALVIIVFIAIMVLVIYYNAGML